MANLQNNVYLEYEQKVSEIKGLEDKISESEDVAEVKRFINYNMKPKLQHEKEWCDFSQNKCTTTTGRTICGETNIRMATKPRSNQSI